MDLKTAAQKLLDIADKIDKQAADLSYYVCSSCNHTATLTQINERRAKAAADAGIETVAPVTVDEKVSCPVPGCDGSLSYVPTDDSERLYVEAQDEGEGDIFEPVDDQEAKTKKKKEKGEDMDLGLDETSDDEGDEGGEEKSEKADETPDEEPEETGEETEEVEDMVSDDDAEAPAEEAPKKKAPKKKKDKPDDEKAALPKEKKPKFEKMPKEAEDEAFLKSVAKYASF